ncbi:hypothetical protein [Aromatoleum petrolei]|uniref:hypothetical protein n=1 Tax=Aromatoleum petrolei TaxID=76116 RepID=UPI001AEC3795|nr:hypothetical protein [Aromatoleum petrolei]QTQ35249.1 Uncharacterized protein ToN1_10800 [Aromatoleum petrolei]
MVPFVDQLCDIRDVVANCRRISQDDDNTLNWFALAITLVGLVPVLGSLAKGCLKILLNGARKAVVTGAVKTLNGSVWLATRPFVEASIVKLNQHLASPPVRKTLTALKIDNVYKHLAHKTRELKAKTNADTLVRGFDAVIGPLRQLVELMERWGSAAMKTQVGQLLATVQTVRNKAHRKLGEVVQPLQDMLERIARRLEVEADMTYRANTNALNPHAYRRPGLEAEVAALRADPPSWVRVRRKAPKRAMEESPAIPEGYPDITDVSASRPLKKSFRTFHTIETAEIPPGTVLYRVIDPDSRDNSICWMRKEEFELLRGKADWRDRFAVWTNWNSNGEFVTYTVPLGKPLKVWEGETASQVLKDRAGNPVKADDNGNHFWTAGGGRQIVLDPADLDAAHLGRRQPTNWGYGNFGEHVDLLGVPTLTNNWHKGK